MLVCYYYAMIKTLTHIYEDIDILHQYIDTTIEDSTNLLIQVFLDMLDKEHIDNILATIRSKLPSATLIGSTTDGAIYNANTILNHTVISFTTFEKTTLLSRLYPLEKCKEEQISERIAKDLVTDETKVLIIFADALRCNGEELIQHIDTLHPNITIAGGLAADGAQLEETWVINDTTVERHGVVAVSLNNPNLLVTTEYRFDWKPLGKTLKITKCDNNRVYEIDNIKAHDIYKRYLGENAASKLPRISAEFPLIIKHEDINIARAVLDVHEDGSLSFAGNFQEGQSVQFAIGNPQSIMKSSADVHQSLINRPIESIFVYSCMARRRFLLENITYELNALSQIADTTGFYTYGEFYTTKTSKELLNQSLTVLALAEERQSMRPACYIPQFTELSSTAQTLEALTHLVDVTSSELSELNSSLEKRVQDKTKELEQLNFLLEEKVADEVLKNREKDRVVFRQMRLAQMGEMISMIAHQWRQPLSTISAIVSSLKLDQLLGSTDEETQSLALDKIARHTAYLSNTIDDFRNFFNPNKQKELKDIRIIIEQAITIISSSFRQNSIELKQDINISKKIEIFPNELLQVSLNMLKNAQDAIKENKITKAFVIIRAYEDEKYTYLEFEDNANGIDDKILENIFDPYFSTKDEKNGTGLGLYMSKVIIEDHCDGKLEVFNTDNGCLFRIVLEHI